MSGPLLTAAEAARLLAVSLRTFRGLIAAGKLPVIRLSPRSVRIDPGDLQTFIEERRSAPARRKRYAGSGRE